ncbi:arabinosyltransferase domain-containing protein [Corynebacterium yudongzhengii]|uniref:arabinosyltransferase domain-containing protein n=1 Tax=Corynebacterium yudongzhengii TaxID=2080740 RepID=UPI001F315040|nr:arabinosyltransferase domain-containing protein [Corynebacterium yudongzhengii]
MSSPLATLGAVSGIAAFLLFILVPFLPVNQVQSSVSWPQNESLNSVNAPLISVAPEKFRAEIPLAAADMVRDEESLILATVPPSGPHASDRGLFINTTEDGGIDVAALSDVLISLSAEDLDEAGDDASLEIEFTGDGSRVTVEGTDFGDESTEDLRPQLTGIYTEIDDTPENYQELVDAGLAVDVEINSRFTSSPTITKQVAMWLGTGLALVAVWALWRQGRDERPSQDKDYSRWRRVTGLDGIVLAILGFWHIFGANTSDDGFILTMARVKENAGYLANFYRWYGVPEAPFGTPYYDLLGLMSQVSANSMWMRLPTLLAGIGIWLLLSREILPRFGANIDDRRVAHWTAAFMFLAFWLPFNNGIRPEPMVALGTLVTWVLFERAIAHQRLFPAALGSFTAALTLTVGPTGLMAVGVFLISLPAVIRMIARRVENNPEQKLRAGLGTIGPFLAAGTFVLVPVFADQTLATVMESTRVRGAVGPALEWYSEYVRYATLFQETVDGSLTRRFAMFLMFACLGLVLYGVIRNGSIPGVNRGATIRLLLIVGLSMFFLMFTPTKWTHHFGIYAGIAGAVAALGAVVLSQIAVRSPRVRTFALATVMFLLALTFAGWNGWWYISAYGVPWWDKKPQISGIEFTSIILLISLLILAFGIFQTFRHEYTRAQAIKAGTVEDFDARDRQHAGRWATAMTAPVALVSILVVLFAMASFVKAFVDQYPAYTVGLGNLRSLTGDTSHLAGDTLLETNTNDSFLTPLNDDVDFGDSLEDEDTVGFGPNGVPGTITSDSTDAANVGAIGSDNGAEDAATTGSTATDNDADTTTGSTGDDEDSTSGTTDTDEDTSTTGSTDDEQQTQDTAGGVRAGAGVNGSFAHLPFHLDPAEIPVVGSWTETPTTAAKTTTAWYELPEIQENTPLLVVSAAGRIAHTDRDGIEQPGEKLVVEFGKSDGSGQPEVLGEAQLLDPGLAPTWRNLRLPLDALPEETDTIRLVAEDTSLDPDTWLAFTPPRIPELSQMSDEIDDTPPALLDWPVALQFPEQRSFDHYAGVTEIPEYRISPDDPGREALSGFQDFYGGGAMATAEAVNTSYEIPSYAANDWQRDWGSLERYQLRRDSEGNEPDKAVINHEEIVRSGLWHESDMKIRED